jgi:hypothetical protein
MLSVLVGLLPNIHSDMVPPVSFASSYTVGVNSTVPKNLHAYDIDVTTLPSDDRVTHSLSTQGGVISGQHECVSLNDTSAPGHGPLLAGEPTTPTRRLGLSVGRGLVVLRCSTAASSGEVLGVPRPSTVGDGVHPPARDAHGVPRPELEVYSNPHYNKSYSKAYPFLKAESMSDDSYTSYHNSISTLSANNWHASWLDTDVDNNTPAPVYASAPKPRSEPPPAKAVYAVYIITKTYPPPLPPPERSPPPLLTSSHPSTPPMPTPSAPTPAAPAPAPAT